MQIEPISHHLSFVSEKLLIKKKKKRKTQPRKREMGNCFEIVDKKGQGMGQ